MNYIIIPIGWPIKLIECPPGLFYLNGTFGFKTEYFSEGRMEVFVVPSGEAFWGGAKTQEDRESLMVIPCKIKVDIES